MSIKTTDYKRCIGGTSDGVAHLNTKPLGIPEKREAVSDGKDFPEVTEDTMLTEIQKLDSIHDFGGSRGSNIACDMINFDRSSRQWVYNAMRMTYIQQCSFNSPDIGISNIPIINFSAFSYPSAASEQLAIDDIENYCVLLTMKKKINNPTKTEYDKYFKYLEMDPDQLQALKTQIKDFFIDYVDSAEGTGKINFIVDTPGDLSKILKSSLEGDNDAFAYVLTQESAHDSASSKTSPLSPETLTTCYNKNGYVEALNFETYKNICKFSGSAGLNGEENLILKSITRKYSNNYNDATQNEGKFESHFTISFGGMKHETDRGKEYYYTDVTYTGKLPAKCKLNQKPHPTNVNTIVKEVKGINTINRKLDNQEKILLESGKKNKFNEVFETKPVYKLSIPDSSQLDYSFTKKRAGDGLQAKVVKLVNSGKLILYCNKQHVMGVNNPSNLKDYIKGGTNIETIYKIKKLVLVTIDRVLFSYCVKNDIPAILSGKGYLLLFKPTPSPVNLFGGSNQELSIKNNVSLKMNNENFNNKSNDVISKKIVQTGGEDIDEIVDLIKNIPYCFLKALPHILYHNRRTFGLDLNKIKDLKDLIQGWAQRSEDNPNPAGKLLSVFLNDKSCIYLTPEAEANNGKVMINGVEYGYCEFDSSKNYIIYTERVKLQKNNDNDFSYKFDSTTATITSEEIEGFVEGKISTDKFYNIRNKAGVDKVDFDNFMQSIDPEYSAAMLEFENMYEGGSISNDQESNDVGMSIQSSTSNDRMSIEGETVNNNFLVDKMPGLNLYLQFFYNNNISSNKKSLTLDENLLVTNNNIAIMSYLSLFNSFEMNMCWDNDGYDENFNNVKGLEVTNKINLYLFIYHLLVDFETQKDKICYGLLEYFIQPKNSSDSYFIIEDDLSSLIHYVTCSYVNLPLSVNKIIENMIDAEIIKTDNEIFTNTRNYFMQLGDKIHNHNIMLSEYLNNESDVESQSESEFVKKYLNMYGFMMMSDIFYANNDEKPEDSEEKKKENEYLRKNKMMGGLKITKKRKLRNRNKRGNKTKNLRKNKKNKKTKKIRKLRNKKTKKGKK
jgi:hypothetical protein